MRRSTALIGALCLALALSSCAEPPADKVEAKANPLPSASALPPEVPVVVKKPAAQFPFDGCGDAIPSDRFEAVTGQTPVLDGSNFRTLPMAYAASEQGGVLHCVWDTGSGDDHMRVMMSVSRSVALRRPGNDPLEFATTNLGSLGVADSFAKCTADEWVVYYVCHFGAVVGDYMVSGYSDGGVAGITSESLDQRIVALASPTVAVLRDSPTPPLWTPPAGSWPEVYDCDALDEAASVQEVTASPSLVVSDMSGRTYDDHMDSREVAALGGLTTCAWSTSEAEAQGGVQVVSAELLAGGAWFWDHFTNYHDATTEVVTIDGADDAVIACWASTAGCELVARIGSNALSVGALSDYTYLVLNRETALAVGTDLVAALVELGVD